MTIEAKIVADSIADGIRITTMELTYPRFIHSEFMTHRMFSRNASSSRAIPIDRMVKQVRDNPAMPIHWGKNQSGMQARVELTQQDLENATELYQSICPNDLPNWWYNFTESHEAFDEYGEYGGGSYQTEPKNVKTILEEEWAGIAREQAKYAEELDMLGLHKQIVNRLLEPFQYIKVIVTATEWDNFFALRLHKDAQPEMMELARVMLEARCNSVPEELQSGFWHLPYVNILNFTGSLDGAIKCSVARCARVSYLNHDNSTPSIDKDIALADMLLSSGHMSPFEHQATPMKHSQDEEPAGIPAWEDGVTLIDKGMYFWSGNFRGWIQNRQLIGHEYNTK